MITKEILRNVGNLRNELHYCNVLKDIFEEYPEIFNTFEDDLGYFKSAKTEVESLDIVVEFEKHVFIFEVKTGSSEGQNQTSKYTEKIKNLFPNRKHTLVFLTYLKEKAKDTSWVNMSHEELYEVVKEFIKVGNDRMFDLYIETMPYVFDKINSDNQIIKHVAFNEEDDSDEVINRGKLKDIIQKRFLLCAYNELNLDYYFILNKSHKKANLCIVIKNFEYKGVTYRLSLSLQGGTFKISIANEDYENSSLENLSTELIEILKGKFAGKNGYDRINPGRTKERISCSKSIKKNYGKDFYKFSVKELSEILKEEIDFIVKTWNE